VVVGDCKHALAAHVAVGPPAVALAIGDTLVCPVRPVVALEGNPRADGRGRTYESATVAPPPVAVVAGHERRRHVLVVEVVPDCSPGHGSNPVGIGTEIVARRDHAGVRPVVPYHSEIVDEIDRQFEAPLGGQVTVDRERGVPAGLVLDGGVQPDQQESLDTPASIAHPPGEQCGGVGGAHPPGPGVGVVETDDRHCLRLPGRRIMSFGPIVL